MLPKIELYDLMTLCKDTEVTQNLLVNIRGCNGSGKSTIPISMLETDENAFEVVWQLDGKERVLATVFPKYQFAALGHYHSKCGGMDSMKTTDEIKLAVDTLWNLNYNILMEGIMASTVRQTYIDLFTDLNRSHQVQREIVVYNLLPPLEVCLDRIQKRNGGKPIKEELVNNKWRIVNNNVQHFKNAGFRSLRVSNEGIAKEESKGNEYILPWTRQAVLDAYQRANMTKDDITVPDTKIGTTMSFQEILDKAKNLTHKK